LPVGAQECLAVSGKSAPYGLVSGSQKFVRGLPQALEPVVIARAGG
jgi:hypothetical protein